MKRPATRNLKLSPRTGSVLEAGLLLGLILIALALPLNRAGQPLPEVSASDIDIGESLIHGLSAPDVNSVTTSMPLSTVWAAAQFGHLGWGAARRAWLLLGSLLLLAAVALACELAPWPAGLLTILILVFALDDWLSLTNTLHVIYALLILCVAWTLARFVRKPSPAAGAALGFAIGTSLLYRSPLLFLPPLLALGFAFRKIRRDRGAARGLALAVLLPILMLIPWMKLNYSLHGRPNPAEHMRSDTNIVSGAMGLVANIEGDIRALAPEAEFEPGRVLGWAVRRVLSSPWTYARAVFQRIGYAASFTPWLSLGALAAFWLGRNDRATASVVVLAVYFLGVHVLMPIAQPYLIPCRMLLSVLAAAAAAKMLTPSLTEEGVSRQFTRLFFRACCAVAGALGGAALLLVLRYDAYGSRTGSPERWAAASTAAPDDAWLMRRRAEKALRSGRPREAAADLGHALALAPLSGDTHALYGYALALSGRPAVLERLRLGPDAAVKSRFELHFFQAAAALRQGRSARARALVRGAVSDWAGTSLTVNRLKTPLERETLAKLRPPPLTAIIGAALSPLTGAEQRVFLEIVAHAAPPEHVADAAALAGFMLLQQNRAADAMPLLRQAVEANAPVVCFLLAESVGGPSRGDLPVAFFDACIARLPNNAKLWADRGVARAGRRDPGAIDDLRKALELDPSSQEAVLSLAYLLQARGRDREALELVEAALARSGDGELRAPLIETASRLRAAR